MKNILILTALAILMLSGVSCKKFDIEPEKSPPEIEASYYDWQECNPKPVEKMGKNAVEGWDNVYDYKFRMHLDGSQIDPNPLTKSEFSIPHVGPGGELIYDNVENDATYTIDEIRNGYVYYTIRSEKGHELKYNIARMKDGEYIWFLKYGSQNDDGVNNINSFVTD